MPVAFLSRPNTPPVLALPALRTARPDQRPRLLVASPAGGGGLAELRSRLAAMGIAAHALERSAGDPLLAVWLAAPSDYTTVAAWCADLLLLGGGWPLLESVLEVLERTASSSRRDCLAALAGIKGVWVPTPGKSGPPEAPTAVDFAPGGAPFDRG
ncbi:MAG TPA: hypothetical protein VFO18_16250 [Methylomirabilota bacterium]|nr:hypothetical protein [Methylomirabilota bacterium]